MTVEIDETAIKKMGGDPNSPVGKLIRQKTLAVQAMAKVLLKIPGSGREYPAGEYFLNRHGKVYHWVRFTSHRASAPGEPPAGDTGLLAASILIKIEVVDEKVTGSVYANAKYGRYQELGTLYMHPRPFLRPALHAAMK